MDPKFYQKATPEQLIQELEDRDAELNAKMEAAKKKRFFSVKMMFGIFMVLVGVGLISAGVWYNYNYSDTIFIRSSKEIAQKEAVTEPVVEPPTVKPKIDPLANMLIFNAELANPSSVKIVCQAHNIPGADLYRPLADWAKQNGFQAILFGNILSFNGRIVLTGPKNLDIEAICERLQSQGITRAIALTINSQDLELPYPFEFTSKGHITFEKEKVKKAFVWPTDKHVHTLKSANMLIEVEDGKARIFVSGKPFEGVPTNDPLKKYQ